MSTDLIEGIEDRKGVTLSLDMNVRGHAFLCLEGVEKREAYIRNTSPDMVIFRLSPDERGHEQAKAIEAALCEWREHTAETKT